MTEKKHIVELSMLNDAAREIASKGKFSKELSEQDLGAIMVSVIQDLMAAQESVTAIVSNPMVKIDHGHGLITAIVSVSRPMEFTLEVRCAMRNSTVPHQLKLDEIDLKVTNAGIITRAALGALDLRGKALSALKNPNQALGYALNSELQPRGAMVESIGLHFREHTVNLSLTGKRT